MTHCRRWAPPARVAATMMLGWLLMGAGVGALGLPTAAAQIRTELSATVSQPRKCFSHRASGRSVAGFAVRAGVTGVIRVRLLPVGTASVAADWDVAVFDLASGRVVAASAGPRSYEVADGQVRSGQRLWIQACRYAGGAARVAASVIFAAAQPATDGSSDRAQLASGSARTPGERAKLAARELGTHVAQTSAGDAGPTRGTSSELPSGRTSYRHLYDYDYAMKELARRHPTLVKLTRLSERSYEGRDISALEITANVRSSNDGKPVFLNAGLIHAREWPSGELPLEWAYDLVQSYGHDRAISRLLRTARTVVVPVVNPDGFSASREAVPLGDRSQADYEDQRKNCDPDGAPPAQSSGICPANPVGTARGTDLNRNFGAFWGDAANDSGIAWQDETYRGTAPFSAAESRALRNLILNHQVTTMAMNHTAAGAVLRPPGVLTEGTPVDEPLLARLGRRLADHNGYPSIPIYGVAQATGGADEWAYWIGGTLALTVELGTPGFHPAYSSVVAEYLGHPPAAGAGRGGNRAAYLEMLRATADPQNHASIVGRAPAGWTLGLRKSVRTPTSPVASADGSTGPALLVTDTFSSRLRSRGGQFRWSVNPSTRPYVAGRYGRDPIAPPQQADSLVNPPGEPPVYNEGTDGPHEEAAFVVQGPPQADNGSAAVRLSWHNPNSGWYADIVKADGSYVSQTYAYDATSETITLHDPEPGTYTVRVVNGYQEPGTPFDDWSGEVSYAGPTPAVAGVSEPWTLTCRRPDGSTAAVRRVTVARGQRIDVGDVCGRRS